MPRKATSPAQTKTTVVPQVTAVSPTVNSKFQFPAPQQPQIAPPPPRLSIPATPLQTPSIIPQQTPPPFPPHSFSLLNPLIVQPAMFQSPEQYERFLHLQEEQIRIAREQMELQKALNLNPYQQPPVSPYQQTGLLMPLQPPFRIIKNQYRHQHHQYKVTTGNNEKLQ